jgi:hypothetical protein
LKSQVHALDRLNHSSFGPVARHRKGSLRGWKELKAPGGLLCPPANDGTAGASQ